MTAEPINAAAAGTWQLGDLSVNRLGFGAMRVTGSAAFDFGSSRDRDQSIRVLRQAVELGVNHIDTAAFYFSSLRSANELINSALSPYPDDLVIVTKVGPGRDSWGEWTPRATPQQLRGQVEENLRQLGRDHLDVVNLRVPGPGPIAEHYAALLDLRDAGLIRHAGVAAVVPEQLAEAREVGPVVCVQNRYGLQIRDAATEDLLQTCRDADIAFVPYFAISGETGPRSAAGQDPASEPEPLRAVAHSHGVTTAQVRLAWTLHQGPNVLAIPGTGDPEHLVQNVASAAIRLSPDELASLDALGQPGP
ncbi:MAG TPA: aldo/keto reductase [Mycobacteriales bacterium]|jgi:aryl-alcohol dehydrogenase-like predicted oxidoreductase|nr:aldo/keto reductase [Mycobacteriales bacterium]